MNKDFYYSNHCPYSLQILNIINTNFSGQFNICNLDEYYQKYNDFPENIRGTPTILVENQNKQISAYEGENIENYLKELSQPPPPPQMNTQQPQQQIPIGGYQMPPPQSSGPSFDSSQGSGGISGGFSASNTSSGNKRPFGQTAAKDAHTWNITEKGIQSISVSKDAKNNQDDIERKIEEYKNQIPIVNGNS